MHVHTVWALFWWWGAPKKLSSLSPLKIWFNCAQIFALPRIWINMTNNTNFSVAKGRNADDCTKIKTKIKKERENGKNWPEISLWQFKWIIYQWHMYLQFLHWAGGMKSRHEILIQSEESELDPPVGFYDVHPDVIVLSSVHVMNNSWTVTNCYFHLCVPNTITHTKFTPGFASLGDSNHLVNSWSSV